MDPSTLRDLPRGALQKLAKVCSTPFFPILSSIFCQGKSYQGQLKEQYNNTTLAGTPDQRKTVIFFASIRISVLICIYNTASPVPAALHP